MRLADHYDVVCTGGSLSSYLCGALLAKSGQHVLVVDDRGEKTPEAFDSNFALFSGLAPSAALGSTLAALELKEINDQFRPIGTVTQVLAPRYRVSFYAGSEGFETTEKDLRRELGQSAGPVCDFFSRLYHLAEEVPGFVEEVYSLSQGSTGEQRRWKAALGPIFKGISSTRPLSLEKILPAAGGRDCGLLSSVVLGSLSNIVPYNLGAEQCVRSLAILLQGQSFFSGGVVELKKALAGFIRSRGGDVKRDTDVQSLVVDRNQIIGVLLSSFEGIVRADTVVLGGRVRRIYKTLPRDMQEPSVLRALRRVRASHWRYTFSVEVRRDVLPIGVTPQMTYVGDYKEPLEEENFLQIRVLPEGQETATLLITALVPYRSSTVDYHYLRRLGGKMLRALSEVIPFLENNILQIHPDFTKGDEQLRKVYPFGGPDWLQESLLQYYVQGHREVQDFWGPSWTTPHSNLYLAGQLIWPSLGLYGEALSARKIYQDIMGSRPRRFERVRMRPEASL